MTSASVRQGCVTSELTHASGECVSASSHIGDAHAHRVYGGSWGLWGGADARPAVTHSQPDRDAPGRRPRLSPAPEIPSTTKINERAGR